MTVEEGPSVPGRRGSAGTPTDPNTTNQSPSDPPFASPAASPLPLNLFSRAATGPLGARARGQSLSGGTEEAAGSEGLLRRRRDRFEGRRGLRGLVSPGDVGVWVEWEVTGEVRGRRAWGIGCRRGDHRAALAALFASPERYPV